MTKVDQERIFIFRRIIKTSKTLSSMSDEELLFILNSSVLPNSISKNTLSYTILSNFILDNKESIKRIEKMKKMINVMSKTEKDILKYGIFYGFDSMNKEYQFSKYLKMSTDISEGELIVRKKIPSRLFESIFTFIYKIIYKGERNERFPRT